MISTKQELKLCIQAELGTYTHPLLTPFALLKMWIRGTERLPIWKFTYSLRHYEYYKNKKNRSLIDKICCEWWRFTFRHNQLRYDLHIEPNTIGEGATIMHPGYRKIPKFVEIGKNATILPMVLIGKAHPNSDVKAIIGDNCYISTGVTILAPVVIGNNVTIGAGAVVTKDVPDNAIVAGVPAGIISIRNDNEE